MLNVIENAKPLRHIMIKKISQEEKDKITLRLQNPENLECYRRLSSAVIAQAIRDVILWRLIDYKEYNDKTMERKFSGIIYDGNRALSFLNDEGRLSLFTSLTPGAISKIIDRKIEDLKENDDLLHSTLMHWSI